MDRSSKAPTRSEQLFERAQGVLVGGVNSPVRAFGAVGGTPVFIDHARGAAVYDADGRRYVDLVGSWGPMIAGHAHPEVVEAVRAAATRGLSFGACCEAETLLGELIVPALPGCELIRFVSSGTEAAMSALRLARAATGRSGVVKFAGCYHGHVDALLVAAGSGAATTGTPDSLGVPPAAVGDTLVAPFNDRDAVAEIMRRRGDAVAAVIVEPVAGNMGLVMPEPGFLPALRALCDEHGSLLVFDEVMTGFRAAWGGYQATAGVRPDLTCLGKVIGGGLPVAAYAGPRRLMEMVSPLGGVYQAGTLSGNPLGMAAGLATLRICGREGFYERLDAVSERLARGLLERAGAAGVDAQVAWAGGMLGLFLSARPVRNFDDARACDGRRFARFFHAMLDRGVWLPPSPFEAMFVSSAHGQAEIEQILDAAEAGFAAVASHDGRPE
jgi:glutamate-1-semialdehyde 2,1-aminomutase